VLRAHYPLRWHLATLFAALVMLAGGLIGFYNQQQLREQLRGAARQQATQIAEQTALRLQAQLRSVEAGLRVLARTRTLDLPADLDDAALREMLRSLLELEPQLAAVFVADGQGRFYILRRLLDAGLRERFAAPPQAQFVSQHIHQAGRAARTSLLDAQLHTLVSREDPDYAARFDPRTRPWYRMAQAEGQLVRTPVYRFFTTQRPGITLAQPSLDTPELVLAADLLLDTLAGQLQSQRLTSGHRLALLSDEGELVSADRPDATSADYAAALAGGAPDWLGAKVPLGLGLNLLTQVPEDELQAPARAAVQRSGLVTLALVLLAVPLTWWLARRVAEPLQRLALQARAIRRFEFLEETPLRSRISEVAALDEAVASMRRSIRRFVEMTGALAEENDFERLQQTLLRHALPAVDARLGMLYLEEQGRLLPRCALRQDQQPLTDALPELQACASVELVQQALDADWTLGGALHEADLQQLGLAQTGLQLGGAIVVPLHNRKRERIGALLLLCEAEPLPSRVRFAEAVAASAATAIETRELIQAQKQLFEAFIELIAAAIDAKSPYTGGHCARVPVLTQMLVQAACDAREGPFADFQLDADGWEAVHVAAWLHDCGKVTTPDYVVDKATKLETIYNRIHELRTRFEVLKRDAEVAHLQRCLGGGDPAASQAQRDALWALLDEEFAFVARCNIGGERMAQADLARLQGIAQRRWQRTLDDRLGLSHEELRRRLQSPPTPLPQWEPLINDAPWQRIERHGQDPALQSDNRWGFRLQVPELLYNRGELINLSVARGTLSAEERFKINEHIVQTVVMLTRLPYPRHLRGVPEIAGAHHERMDGTGYPRRLTQAQMSVPARIMAIADVFEALTAADRPYKPANSLSEALALMAGMAATQHIDAELFALFVRSGVARRYAERFMSAQQLDELDAEALLQAL
jgi:HD-GYP domain-containing protein (c-di-GMP phosphodiesterase class II)